MTTLKAKTPQKSIGYIAQFIFEPNASTALKDMADMALCVKNSNV